VKGNGALRHWNLGGTKANKINNKKYIYRFRFQRQAVALTGSTSLTLRSE